MKILTFTIRHAMLERLMCEQRLARLFKVEDLGHERDHYEVVALVNDANLDAVVDAASDRPQPIDWPHH